VLAFKAISCFIDFKNVRKFHQSWQEVLQPEPMEILKPIMHFFVLCSNHNHYKQDKQSINFVDVRAMLM